MDTSTIPAQDASGDRTKPRGFQLLVISNETRVLYPLPERGTVIVGGSSRCDVRIVDVLVDFCHVCIHIGASFEIEDLGSCNGTYIAGKPLGPLERTSIVPGEAVTVGASTLIIQA